MSNPSQIQKYQICKELEQYVTKLPDGYCEYKNGGSDQKIAKKHGVGLWTVQNLRRELFGKITDKPGTSSSHGRLDDIETLCIQTATEVTSIRNVLRNILLHEAPLSRDECLDLLKRLE